MLTTVWRWIEAPLHDLQAGFEAQVVWAPRPYVALAQAVLGAVLMWWAYVPVHELLHALGCVMTGGSISELQIAPVYGGAWLARLLPFVVVGGEYAGRLSGFDTAGSDAVYLATDAGPFALTVGLGVPVLRAGTTGRRPALFGAAIVLALAPFYCLSGDYYEMGSIVVTRVLALFTGGTAVFSALRADDLFRLGAELWERPASFGVTGVGSGLAAIIVVVSAQLVGLGLALLTYAAGAWFAALCGYQSHR